MGSDNICFEVIKMRLTKKTTLLFAAVMLVSAVTAVTVFAQPSAPDNSKEHLGRFVKNISELPESQMGIGNEGVDARPFIEPILVGQGFALQGDQYHILNVDAIKIGNVSQDFIHSLISQNKSREEIAKEIQNNAQVATKTSAHLRFAGQEYDINVTGYDNQSLTGDVLTLPPGGTNQTGITPAIVGHISLSISNYEGEVLSTGTLTINGTDYKVLLMSPSIAQGGGLRDFNGTLGPDKHQ